MKCNNWFTFYMLLYFCRFIEYGEYKDNLYGTSLESIHRILDQNKACLVDVQPEVSVYTDMQYSQPNTLITSALADNYLYFQFNIYVHVQTWIG